MKRLLSLVLTLGLSVSLALPACALEVDDAKELLKTYYVDPLPEQFDEMDDLNEILAAINDPYTSYLSAEEYASFLDSVNGESIVGIGVSIQTVYDNGYQVLSILPGSPALESSLAVGDFIVAVDEVPLTAGTDPTALIRGEEGTQVTLTIRQKDSDQLYTITLTRTKVTIPIVSYELLDNALVIYCDSFGESTTERFQEALTEFEEQAAVCIVDLRSNPGGTSTAAAGAAGLFLGGTTMSYFRGADDGYSYVYTPASYPDLSDKPLIILTSAYSASGSELFAAAIRDYKAGISIGQRTFGKGVAQYIFDQSTNPDLFDGDCLKITVYRFFSPDGATNDTVGVLPTLMISDENAPAVALMLSGTAPSQAERASRLRLELCGQTFYIDAERALADEPSAFCELLEALPPSAILYKGSAKNNEWEAVSPDQIAAEYGLTRGVLYHPRRFSDCDTSPYANEIHTLSAYQLISGDGNQNFFPNRTITRAEFCAMLSSALSLNTSSNTDSFTDVAQTAWYADEVSAMAQKGFIAGYEDHTFRPDCAITYQEMVTILNHVAAWATMEGYDYDKAPLSVQNAHLYLHYAPWAQVPARNLDRFGALLTDTAPSQTVTREEAAASLCRLLEGCGLLWR